MAKKKDVELTQQTILKEPLEDIFGDRFGRYSKAIIQDRALPDARDGFKPVQRRILYTMFEAGNTFEHQYRKSAKTVGLVIGNYHPHGDSSVYEAMVRLSQSWKVRLPLVDMHGNNGSIDDDPAAAMRYTEARLASISSKILEDINKDTVEWAPNYDDTAQEPTVFPTPFPLLLVNGATGIAAGYATNTPPHNLGETIEATIYRLQNPKCSLEEIMEILPGPDFPTGGIVQGKDSLVEAYQNGRGKIIVRAKTEIVETKSCNQIVITEIPYEVIKQTMVRKIDEIRLNKDIDGMMDVRDETDRNGLRIVIDTKKDVDPKQILNYLFKNTDLQVNYNYNVVAIVEKRPVQMGLLALLDAFIDYRKETVLRRCRFEYQKMEDRCEVLEGLIKAISVLDEVIAIIRKSKDKGDSKANLIKAFKFTENQAEAIVTLRLYRLSNTDIKALKEEFAELVNKMEETKTILESPKVLRSTLVKELRAIKNEFGDERRTLIEDEVEEITFDKTQMIANERVMVSVSRDGYVKRVSLRSFNSSDNSLCGLKEGDAAIGWREVDTLDTLLIFTSKGNYAYLPVYQIGEAKWKDVGTHISSYMKMDGDDKVVSVVAVKNFDTYAWICTISAKGNVKKTPLSQWAVSRNNKVMPAMKMRGEDALLDAFLVYAHQDIALVSHYGYMARYNVDLIPSTNAKSQGVKAQNFSKEDALCDACVLGADQKDLLVVTEQGGMKRIHSEDIPVTSRPVKGEMICKRLKKDPSRILFIASIGAYDDCLFVDQEPQLIQGKDIPIMDREATFGNPLHFVSPFYYVKGIEEAAIVDRPADDTLMEDETEESELKNHTDFEMLDLFEKKKKKK